MAKGHAFGQTIGKEYMEGRISIAQVQEMLHKYPGKDMHEGVRQGALEAQYEGKAVASRVQPKQGAIKFGPLEPRYRAGKKGQLATRPEHSRYKAPAKIEVKATTKTPTAAKPKSEIHTGDRKNLYEVQSQRKKDLKILLDKHAKGGYGVKEVKREAKVKAAGAARKNVVYNETKHKYVGKNRVTQTKETRPF